MRKKIATPVVLTMTETNNAKAKAELAMMSVVVKVENDLELEVMLDYISTTLVATEQCSVFKGEDVLKKAYEYTKKDYAEIQYLSVSTVEDMVMITLPMTTNEDKMKDVDLTDRNGVFCYVYNANVDYFSELGYSYFKKKGNFFNRIG